MFSCHSVLYYSLNDYKYLMFRIRFSQSFENSRKKSIVLRNKVYQPKKKKGLWVISLIILFLIKNLHKFYNIVVTKSLCEVCGFFLVVKYVLKIFKNFFRGIAKWNVKDGKTCLFFCISGHWFNLYKMQERLSCIFSLNVTLAKNVWSRLLIMWNTRLSFEQMLQSAMDNCNARV